MRARQSPPAETNKGVLRSAAPDDKSFGLVDEVNLQGSLLQNVEHNNPGRNFLPRKTEKTQGLIPIVARTSRSTEVAVCDSVRNIEEGETFSSFVERTPGPPGAVVSQSALQVEVAPRLEEPTFACARGDKIATRFRQSTPVTLFQRERAVDLSKTQHSDVKTDDIAEGSESIFVPHVVPGTLCELYNEPLSTGIRLSRPDYLIRLTYDQKTPEFLKND